MSNLRKEDIITLLKYLDFDIMAEEVCDSIYDLDINNEEQQLQVIRTAIVPAYRDFNPLEKESIKKVLGICLQEDVLLDDIFQRISFPFDNEIIDKKIFLENIYKELFDGQRS
ncbi:hypothetical protein [Paenibacillus sp. Aloe-11]|uniref:hypothetical protein n=1 Tax=Paenibacillus sp. Aloe-11 TaxID=1050222 RepID=UPI00030880D0|nr:hypothetical protein [Paenibacillus sp. Aloe-11]